MTDAIVPVSEPSVLATDDDRYSTLEQLGDVFILPIAKPDMLRKAFAEKQKLYAAILDPSDYIYTVRFVENGRSRETVYSSRDDAEKAANTYKTDYRAAPKKSGIVKLAVALGIEAKRKLVRGLPDEANANYSYVVYEAIHARTGRMAEGIGWCDKSERGGRISTHDVIATADTRAYNRAILRLAGFADVSGEEVVAGAVHEDDDRAAPQGVVDVAPAALKKPMAPPSLTDENVLAAARAWAEEISKRDGQIYVPEAQQNTRAFRELRARARRGDTTAARNIGSLGVKWEGPAQDGQGFETFQVEAPPVKPEDVLAVRREAASQKAATAASETMEPRQAAESEAARPTEPRPAEPGGNNGAPTADDKIPAPSPDAETITLAQAKKVSELLTSKLGTKEAAREWLTQHAHVGSSREIKANQFEKIMAALGRLEAQSKEA